MVGHRRALFILTLLIGVLMLMFASVSLNNVAFATIKREFVREFELQDPEPDQIQDIELECMDRLAPQYNRVEDLYCEKLPPFEPKLKNPCIYVYEENMRLSLRCLPYFYIIGMDKCGTTDLHSKIESHPDVRGNTGLLGKESLFWSWSRYGVFHNRPIRKKATLTNYFQMFHKTSLEIQHKKNSSHIITGDATPMDLWDFRHWDLIPQNVNKSEPEVLTPHLLHHVYKNRIPKILIQLREPVERLYSDYIFLGQGKNPHTFHAHVLKAVRIIQDCLKTRTLRLCFFDKTIYRRLPTRIHLGCYSVYLQEWLSVFPLQAFHITRTEDFNNNMPQVLHSIYSFLNLAPLPEENIIAIANQSRRHITKSKKGKILPETFSILYEFYLPCLKETANLLNDRRYLWEDIYSKHADIKEQE